MIEGPASGGRAGGLSGVRRREMPAGRRAQAEAPQGGPEPADSEDGSEASVTGALRGGM